MTEHTKEARLLLAAPKLLAALIELLALAPSKAPAAGLIVGIEERYAAAVKAAREAIHEAKEGQK